MDMTTLQHERGHSKKDAWLDHWKTLHEEQAKVHFLMMLKGRRDNQSDADAGDALFHLGVQWIHEKFMP